MTSTISQPLAVALALATLGGGCGGGAPASRTTERAPEPTSGAATAPAATSTGQIVLREEPEPPPLSETDVAEDARDPEVVVSGDSPWVLVPSFRMGVQLPAGWYRTTPDAIVESLQRTYGDRFQTMTPEERGQFERSLRGAVDRYPADAQVLGLIPSVRVLLIPFGGVPPTDFCTRESLPFTQQGYPNATLTGTSWTEVLGRRAARCTTAMVANTVRGDFPATQELLWIFGESHTVLIISMGNQSDPVGATLDAVIGSIRRL